MFTSTYENERWLVEEMVEEEDSLEHLKAFFTCAFMAGSKNSREFLAKSGKDEILEREWDKALILLRGIVASGAIAQTKEAMKMTRKGFDA